MTNKEASEVLKASSIQQMSFCKVVVNGKEFNVKEALNMAIKSLETIQRIDDVLNVEGMTEIDVLDEIMEAVSEFKYDCGVDE